MKNKNIDHLEKYLVPVFIIAYGETEQDAIEYVEHAFDSTELLYEDGIFSLEILEEDVEQYF